jgi:hypothetical protein
VAYYKTVWSSGDIITKQGLNNIETGIETLDNTKADKTDVPTKVSQLTNDSGFITEANINNKVDRSEMNSALLLKADKTEIPKNVSELTNDKGYLVQADIDLKANKSDVDAALALKADKSEIPVNVSQLANDAGYITDDDIDLSEYAKSADVNAALELKADKTQLEGLATESYVDDAILNALAGEEIDLSSYAKTADVIAKDEALKAELQAEIDADVQDEKDRAMAAESALNTAISNEVDRAKDVEADLQAAIDLKADKTEIPTNVSAFNNDAGYLSAVPDEYITESELDAKKLVSSDVVTRIAIVDALPDTEEPGVLYFVRMQ